MNRIIRIAAATALVLLATAGLTACGPSAEDVCEHMNELAKKEGLPGDGDIEACVEMVDKQKESAGLLGWRSQGNCIMDAEDIEQALKCDSE